MRPVNALRELSVRGAGIRGISRYYPDPPGIQRRVHCRSDSTQVGDPVQLDGFLGGLGTPLDDDAIRSLVFERC